MSNQVAQKARAEAATCGPRRPRQGTRGEMEFPSRKRFCDIKSDVSYLFIVVCLAWLQITASCALSLRGPFAKTEPSFLTAMYHIYNSRM